MQPWPIKWSKPEKRKPLPDNNEEKGKKIRKFNAQWMNDRKWLKYDDHVNLMFCVPCTNFVNSKKNRTNYPNSFIKGCSNFKTSALSDHESSRLHKDAVQFEMALANPTKTIARQTLVNLNEHKRKQLEILFRNVHALVKNNRPLSDIEWLTELDRAKGVDCGETYANRKSATVFLEYIAMHESQKVSELVQKVKFFSMSMDGSTDEGCVEQETLFVRTCLQGKLQTKFLCIGEPKSTSSADLHALVLEQIEIYGLHSPELVGFGCDGAANMLGKKGGLVTLLKKDRPELHAVHCHAHKLELAFRDVVKPDLKYARLSTLLLGIYYFYKRSPKQRKCLKSTFQVMDIKGTLPHRVSGSRWMPHMHRALATLFKSFPAYITQLRNESHTNAKAEGLAKLLGNYQVMVYATLLRDILNPLVKLSLCLQSVDVTLADVHLMVEAILALLCSLKDHKSEALVQMEDCKELSGISLKVQGKPINSANVMENLIDKITQAIKSRFIDLTDVQFTEVSNFSNWPVALKDYGDDHIEVSSRRFAQTLTKQGIKTEDLKEQWNLLKH